jgi:hypothetical protein
MASRFVTDEHFFLLNEAAVSPNTKKATKFCLTVCGGILRVNTVLFTTITGAEIQIVLKIFSQLIVSLVSTLRISVNILVLFTSTSVNNCQIQFLLHPKGCHYNLFRPKRIIM